jgi:Phosphate acetyl/butaryl transferase
MCPTAKEGKGEVLMKGSLHTDELMRAVTASKTGLRTARRISHVFVMDVPTYAETLFITDAAINIFPDLDVKRDIIQNVIDLFTQVGLGTPRVAILSAVETVTSKIPSTIEAAALYKMAERGQITGECSTGRSRSTMRSTRRPQESRESNPRSPDAPRSWSFPISKPATCSPRTSRSSPRQTRPGSCSGRACRSS